MGQAARWHAVRAAWWSRAPEGRASAALLLAAHGPEQLERDVVGAFCAAADRRLAAEEANPRLPLEAG